MNNGKFLGVRAGGDPRLPVVYQGHGHVVTVAGPGSGKTLGVLVPNLITARGSTIVTDFKGGEITRLVSAYQEHVLQIPVAIFDPMRTIPDKYLPLRAKESDKPEDTLSTEARRCRFDPVDFIIRSDTSISAGAAISVACNPSDNLREPHWSTGAANYLNAMLQFVAFDPIIDEKKAELLEAGVDDGFGRNFRTVWRILSSPSLEKWALSHMVNGKNPFVADQASAFYKASKANTEIQSIRNHLRVNLSKILGEPKIVDALSDTNVNFTDLAKRPQAIIIALPGYMAQTHHAYMRLMTMMLLTEIEKGGLRKFDAELPPIHFELDEFATLGRFPQILDAMARMRGLGVNVHLYVQTLSQLHDLYDKGFNTIMGTAGCVQYFGGTNDKFTAEYLSELSGTATILNEGANHGQAPNSGSESQSTTGRRVRFPDEIMRLPLPLQMIKLVGHDVAFAEVSRPDLSDFPRYREFMRLFEAEGVSGPEAARRVAHLPEFRPPYFPPPEPLPPPPPKPRKSLAGLLDGALAMLMGHDTK